MLATTDTLIEPAHLWVPPHATSAGGDAADLAESAGLVLDPEQRLILNTLLAEKPNGKWAALEAAVIMSRQNGKTVSLIAIVLAHLYLLGSRTVVWSAHETKTAFESFLDIRRIIENCDHLMREVKPNGFHLANGNESIELRSGQRLLFKARTKSGGRGLSGDVVVLDEAFALTPPMIGTLMPLLSAKTVTGNPQLLYASSAGKQDSAVLRRIRDRGRAGNDPSLAYVEWCAPVRSCADDWCDHSPHARGCVLDDEDAWRRANPSLESESRIGRISRDYVRNERRSMPPEEFVRERLGWWDEPRSERGGVPLEFWTECAKPGRTVDAVQAISVDVSPEFSHASVAVAGDGGIELVAHERGTSWVPALLAHLLEASPVPVVLDARGPASVLLPELSAVGIDLVKPSGLDMAHACAGFLDAVVRSTLWHPGQDDLDSAVRGAKRIESGDSFKWSRKSSSVDISPLVAVTLAVWGARGGSSTGVAHEPFMVIT